MSPPRTVSSARPSLTAEASAAVRKPLLRRQRSADDDRPISQLLHSALKVTASALGPGILAEQTPPTPPKPKGGPLRPVRVAWAELRGAKQPQPSPRSPTCLPALARANLDIFLAHSGLAQCLANIDLARDQSPKSEPMRSSPREAPIKAALTPIPRTPTLAAASSRRVNFRSAGRNVNRSFNESPEPQKLAPPVEPKNGRILSAPSHRTAPILTPPRPMLRSLPRRSPLNSSFESETSTDTRVKSANSRRRLKSASAGRGGGRRGARKGDDTSDDEACEESPGASAPPRPSTLGVNPGPKASSRRGLHVGAEIVTMVSLISPAGSSDSDSETTPGVHQVVPVPSAPQAAPAWQDDKAAPGDGDRCKNPPLAIVCARKINKSVSFQSRSSLPELLRRASIQLTMPAKSEKELEDDATRVNECAEAEKTPVAAENKEAAKVENLPQQPAPAAGIMKAAASKRKLARPKPLSRQNSKSDVENKTAKQNSGDSAERVIIKEPDKPDSTPNPPAAMSILKAPRAPLASAEEMDLSTIEGNPKFESPKEQECWHLYRKMCEKGLSVSFDTVLRGMLTPTEYRLRKGALLSSC